MTSSGDTRGHVDALARLASSFPGPEDPAEAVLTRKLWCAPARTFTYQTHVAADATREALDRVADVFFGAADLPAQPWYEQFRGGASRPTGEPAPEGIDREQLCLSSFDVGLGRPRCYRVLVSLASPAPEVRVVALRSVDVDWSVPEGSVLAETLEPSGDVFTWEAGRLHWHHICTTPGVGLLPGALDRWLLNALRRFGLDGAERRTYRDEALGWCDWVASGAECGERRGGEGRD